jgi:hypothetical protein
MPVRSQAQREYLNWKFGHAWVKAHHFDQPGKLPAHVNQAAARTALARRKRRKGK